MSLRHAAAWVLILLATREAGADKRAACLKASSSAQDLRRGKKLIEARAKLLVCARESCPAVVRRDCTEWLADIDTSLPTVVITVSAPNGDDVVDARVMLDGELYLRRVEGIAQPMNPGVHTLRVDAAGASVEQRVVVREGEKNQAVRVLLPGSSRPSDPKAATEASAPTVSDGRAGSSNRVPITLGATAIVLLGAGLGFSMWGDSTYEDAKAEVVDLARRGSLYDSANTKRYVAQGFAVAGLGCAVMATWLYIRGRDDDAAAARSANLVISPTGIALLGAF